jgi:cysteine-rich repeat protein
MQRVRFLAPTLVLLALVVLTPVASAKGLCAPGRFQLGNTTGRDAAALGGAVLVFGEGTVELAGMCGARDVGRSYYYGDWFYRTRLRLDATCAAELSRARIRVRFDFRRECRSLTGKLRTRNGRTRFTAQRIPTCGNRMLEDGETCDDSNVVDGDCCDRRCQAEPGCQGPCERSADCHPDALCARYTATSEAGCATRSGWCDHVGQSWRDSVCPAPPPLSATVCGCDRQSYATTCDAWAAGVTVRSVGRCPCRPSVDPCPEGYFCDLPYSRATCDAGVAAHYEGECVKLGVSCDGAEPWPVCGCDGVPYPDDCARQQAGVWQDPAGTCRTP